ncbi:MAG: ArsC family reductase [Burkholderiaceae bacterium]
MAIVLHGIPNCDQVRKARGWLDERGLPYRFHDFRKAGIDPAALASWERVLGWEALLNRRGTTWRALSDAQRAAVVDAASACAAMIEAPSLIKRPLLDLDGSYHAGFSESAYASLFPNLSDRP